MKFHQPKRCVMNTGTKAAQFVSMRRKKLCFLQWYEMLQPDNAPIDAVEKNLNCVRLRWQRRSGTAGQLSPSKDYRFVPLECIRFVIHVVEKSTQVTNMFKFQSNGTADGGQQYPSHSYDVKEFYMNRFYREKWDQFLTQE